MFFEWNRKVWFKQSIAIPIIFAPDEFFIIVCAGQMLSLILIPSFQTNIMQRFSSFFLSTKFTIILRGLFSSPNQPIFFLFAHDFIEAIIIRKKYDALYQLA